MSIISRDAANREKMLANIAAGLSGPDAAYWRDRAKTRRDALREDEPTFGLLPHEQRELDQLNRLLDAPA